MNALTKAIIVTAALALASGCTSTQKRAATVGGGTAVGAAAGYLIGDKEPGAAAIGAVVGGLGTALALGEDKDTYQRGYDDGYVQASSDAVKRLYWQKQALEHRKEGGKDDGSVSYYVWEEEGTTPDGRKLAPEKVAVAVYEPKPKD